MSRAVRRLFPYLNRYRRAFVVGLTCVVLTTAFQLMSPWILRYAIDDLHAGVTRRKLLLYAGLLLGVSLVRGVFLFLMRRIIIGASRDIEFDVRNDFFARLEQQPLGYYQERRTGDLMSRATNDLNAVRMMIGPAVMYTANTVLVFIVAILLMAAIDGRLTLVALIPLPFVSIAVRYFGSAIHTRFEAIQAQLSDVSAVVQEALSGVRVVRAYRQEAHEIARFHASNTEYLRRNRVLIRLQGAFYPSMTLFLGFGSLLVLWLGSHEVIHGRITLGEFVAFNGYLVMLSWPMIAFGWVTNILQRGFASWGRMLTVIDAPVAISDAGVTQAGRAVSLEGAIEVRNLTFTYPGSDRPALRDISLRIEPGQTVAVVGATGSGKSTLISLLPRLHEPPAGAITVGGVDIREIPLERLRGAIGFVPQEPFLFSDTIGENVAFGASEGHGQTRTNTDQAGHGQTRTNTDLPGHGQTRTNTDLPGHGQTRTNTDQGGHGQTRTNTDQAGHGQTRTNADQAGHGQTRTNTDRGGHGRTRMDTDLAGHGQTRKNTDLPGHGQTRTDVDQILDDTLAGRVSAAAAVARLDKDVADFPRGFETMVGERGITLSGGQKQRTALARAVMIDPVILVLDDALSAVDTYTEEEILSRLREVMRRRTSILVSHRVSTVREADQILVLDEGRIVERGRHDALVARGGLYAAMYRKQLLEEELQAS